MEPCRRQRGLLIASQEYAIYTDLWGSKPPQVGSVTEGATQSARLLGFTNWMNVSTSASAVKTSSVVNANFYFSIFNGLAEGSDI